VRIHSAVHVQFDRFRHRPIVTQTKIAAHLNVLKYTHDTAHTGRDADEFEALGLAMGLASFMFIAQTTPVPRAGAHRKSGVSTPNLCAHVCAEISHEPRTRACERGTATTSGVRCEKDAGVCELLRLHHHVKTALYIYSTQLQPSPLSESDLTSVHAT
jgi:hypothetical protein